MTKTLDVERLAREAHFDRVKTVDGVERLADEAALERFAALIRNEVLEEAAEVAADMDYSPDGAIATALRSMKTTRE